MAESMARDHKRKVMEDQIRIVKLQQYADEMVREYQPERHVEYVQCIMASGLSKKAKMKIIRVFNMKRDMYYLNYN